MVQLSLSACVVVLLVWHSPSQIVGSSWLGPKKFELLSLYEAWETSALHSLSLGLVVFHYEIQRAPGSILLTAQNGTSQALDVSLLVTTAEILA